MIVLVRAALGRRVWQVIDAYAGQGVRLFAPDVAFEDAEKYVPLLLEHRLKPVPLTCRTPAQHF